MKKKEFTSVAGDIHSTYKMFLYSPEVPSQTPECPHKDLLNTWGTERKGFINECVPSFHEQIENTGENKDDAIFYGCDRSSTNRGI